MATDLREALRPVVAFRGMLEKATTLDHLRLSVLETNLPVHISKVLDLHQNMLLALALISKADEPQSLDDKIKEQLAEEPQMVVAPQASFTDD